MDFLDQHNFLTLIGLAVFPRLTMLIVSFKVNHNIDYWLGYIFAPHLLAAIYSLNYWDTNPVLVIIAWIFAIGATPTEVGYSISLGIGLFSSIRKRSLDAAKYHEDLVSKAAASREPEPEEQEEEAIDPLLAQELADRTNREMLTIIAIGLGGFVVIAAVVFINSLQ